MLRLAALVAGGERAGAPPESHVMNRDINEPKRADRPRENLPEAVKGLATLWMSMAEVATDIAHAKRAVFLAYVAEGFSEAQALELVKTA